MNDLFKRAVSLSLLEKSAAAVIGILLIHTAFRVLEQTLTRRFGQADARYKVRKFLVFTGYFTILLFVTILFEDRLGRLSFAVGIAGAGVAVALQDVVASLAGAFAIGFSRLYTAGDRVQIGDTRGDVIDVGNWVSRDLYSGRLVLMPNSMVLKGPVFNYSQGFGFIWDEIKVVLTTSSDCQFAREMLLRVANQSVGGFLVEAQTSWKTVSENYQNANPSLEPTVALVVNSGSLEFTVDYVVDYTQRSAMKDRLFTKIVEEVANSGGRLQWASSGVTVINQPQPSVSAIAQAADQRN
jgi:small-conductance mechanosensitive channel